MAASQKPKLICVKMFREVLSLVICSQGLLFCSYSDDEKKKKHKRKVRSGSKTEPIVWKTDIENFHNIYAELGRLVDEKAMFFICNMIVSLSKCTYQVPRARNRVSTSRVTVNLVFS